MNARETARQAIREIPNLLTLLAFFAATALIFRSVEFALIVTASLGFHELGHAAAIAWFGLEWRISFGLVGAWTWSPLAERERLSQASNAAIHLAGPVFSLLLAVAALALNSIWQPRDPHLLTLANFSAQVGLLNLLPLGGLSDGGRIVQRMVKSLEPKSRPMAVMLPLTITAVMLIIFMLGWFTLTPNSSPTPALLSLLMVGLWMGSSLLIETRRVESSASAQLAPAKAPLASAPVFIPVTGSPRGAAMQPRQVYLFTFLMWGLLVLALIISATTPFWLEPRYLLGSLQNIVDLFRLMLGRM